MDETEEKQLNIQTADDTPPQAGVLAEHSTNAEQTEEIPVRATRKTVRGVLLKILIIGLLVFVVFIGLGVMLYPSISNYINEKNQSRMIAVYATNVQKGQEYSQYFEAARAYNKHLANAGMNVHDSFAAGEADKDKTNDYWSLLNVSGNGMMGYVDISLLKIRLPIYHGTSEATLAKGAGHLQGSSLPVGGGSTHAVITGHTGLPSASLFTGIDRLKIGDTFKLYILDEVLTYRVDQIRVILPYEIEDLAIEKDKDYVTLVTCTPYGINTHRLLVRGERVEDSAVAKEAAKPVTSAAPTPVEKNWFSTLYSNTVIWFATALEAAANWYISVSEWVMDKFKISY